MASKKEIIINCGTSSISVSTFSFNGNQCVLDEVSLHTQNFDYLDESLWLEETIKTLEEVTQELKLRGEVRVIIPGSLLLTKTIRVPKVEKDKQDKIVAFELSQKMPFPLSELIWDYRIIDDDGVEQEILAFAVKPEIAEKFCERLIQAGLSPSIITPAPILEHESFKALETMDEDGETLIINIGAKSTNLLFINKEGFLIRNIAIGGNSLTQSISENLGLVFEKGEEIKKAVYSGAVNLTADDPRHEVLGSCSSKFLARISQEITRSIVTYKRIKKGKSISKIYLSGRGALLAGLPEYISQSQQLNIDYFDPLQAIQVSSSVSEEMKTLLPFMLSESVGLAIKLFQPTSDNLSKPINLLPSSKISTLNFKKKSILLTISSLILSICPLPFIIANLNEISVIETKIDDFNTDLKRTQAKKEEVMNMLTKHNYLLSLNDEIISSLAPLLKKHENRNKLLDVLNFLQSTLDKSELKDVWFDQFRINTNTRKTNLKSRDKNIIPTQTLFLSGRYLVRPSIEVNNSLERMDLRETLIELNSAKQDYLTSHLQSLPYLRDIPTKVFSIEDKGNLFEKYYTHFEYEIVLQF